MLSLNEVEKFKDFLEESFGEGVNIRELRLSNEETEYIKRVYPRASFNPLKRNSDGKSWYKVTLQPKVRDIKNAMNLEQMVAIQKENLQLKQELERLKKSTTINSER